MKPREKKPEIVYRIIDNENNEAVGSYSRADCDEYDFNSIRESRNANFSGTFKDKETYRIAKYKVTYELLDDDVDPITEEEKQIYKEKKDAIKEIAKEWDKLMQYIINLK